MTMRSATGDLRIFDGGDDAFHVWAGGVTVPHKMFEFLRVRNIVSALALVSFLRATPSALWKMGMRPQERRDFTAMVLWKLRRFFPIGRLVKRKPIQRAYGAVKPPPV